MTATVQGKLLNVLDKLRAAGVHFTLRQDRENAVSVDVAVPGERWEIDVLADGSVEVEVFKSDGTITDESTLDSLLANQKQQA